jgi:hypothetical protein
MTFPRDTCPHTIDAGAWLLHALPDEDGERFAAHLASGCLACRAEVEDLRLVVDVLPSAVAQVPPPPALKGRLMSVVRAEAELLQATGPEADRPVRAAAAGRPRRERGRWWGLLLRPALVAQRWPARCWRGVAGGSSSDGGPTRGARASSRSAARRGAWVLRWRRGRARARRRPQAPAAGSSQVLVKARGK